MTLGFIYISDNFSYLLQLIIEKLSTATRINDEVDIVGLDICYGRHEIYKQPALSLLLTDIDPANYRLLGLDNQLEDLHEHRQEKSYIISSMDLPVYSQYFYRHGIHYTEPHRYIYQPTLPR